MSLDARRNAGVSLNSSAFCGLVAAEFTGTFASVALSAMLWHDALLDVRVWGLLIVPFVACVALAGFAGDNFRTSTTLFAARAGQVAALAGCAGAAALGAAPASLGLWFTACALFCMLAVGTHFSPAKHVTVRELIVEDDLSKANGILLMASLTAMVLGYVTGSHPAIQLSGRIPISITGFAGVALTGAIATLLVPRENTARRNCEERGGLLVSLVQGVRTIRSIRSLMLTVFGLAYFWFLAVGVGRTLLRNSDTVFDGAAANGAHLLMVFGLSAALGSFLAARLSSGMVELGLVPIGALGLAVFLIALGRTEHAVWWLIWLFLVGASGGLFCLPLVSFLQVRAPRERLAGCVAASNLLSVLLALAALETGDALLRSAGWQPRQIVLAIGMLTLAVTAYSCWLLPEFAIRFIFWTMTHTIYRIRVTGRENVPQRGPGLLVCNHVSYADGFFVVASHHRLIRFLIYGGIVNHPYLRWLGRVMGAIPIASTDGPRALANSLRVARDALRNGELVCIFAEGQISRTGNMLRFNRGFEKIIHGVDAPIIPTFLDCVWGSVFSHQGGRFLWKLPKRVPYPVTVNFGKPLPPTAAAFQVRQAVQELGAESVAARKREQPTLHAVFVRQAARHPFRFCIADSGGTELTYGKALVGTIALERVLLRRLAANERMVGVLLPPSVGGVLVNLSLLAAGRIPVNLNYTASLETIASCVKQCQIKTIISSPLVLKRIRIELPIEPTPVEDLKRDIRGFDKIVGAVAAYVLPGWVTERWLLRPGRTKPDDLATIIFSSGSTGEPKGVMLSHHNLVSNAEAVLQVIDPTPADRIVGLLPLFHSFGFLANLGVPFLVGCGAAYHNNPLDAKEVGELTAKHGGTILLATPTFLRAYTRKIPPEQLKTLRWLLTGAEKLPREVAESFRDKFGLEPMEGYGCTELSPVAAVNIPDFVAADGRQIGNKPGTVGHPVPGVAAKIVDPDTFADLPNGSNGLLLIKGPNVMQGYFGRPDLTAQAIRDGWYVTGDIANLDEDGFITITDRLSRFSKIGGEMVPHVRIEETIRSILGTDDQGGVVAGVPDPTRGERLVVIHPPLPISIDELWQKLRSSGLPNLWIPSRDSFYEVAELPYLGSGKLDLKRIKDMARELSAAKAATPV